MGSNPRKDDSHSQPCVQTEKEKSLLKEKYTVEKLYIVINDVVSTSELDVSAAKGTLIAVIKRQDPMGDTSRWYVDTGVSQGFLPSQELKPVQQQSQTPDIATVGKSSTSSNLMSLDSPEKEIKKESHLQEILSLDVNQELRVTHNYSNVPEIPKVQMYQNVHNEVSNIIVFNIPDCALTYLSTNIIRFLVLLCDVRFCWKHTGHVVRH